MKTSSLLRAAFLGLIASVSLSAATLSLTPTADSGIRSDQTSNTNNSNLLLVGDTSGGAALRGLLNYDLSSSALFGATINSVTLTLTINDASESANSGAGTITINLYSLSSAFTETTANWQSNGSSAWSTAGGDYSTLLSATTGDVTTVVAGSKLTFQSTSDFVNLVSSVAGTGSLNLLLKLSTEDAIRNIFRFTSKDYISVASSYRPTLTIDYTPAAIPEPSTAALLGGVIVLGFVGLRRRSR